jgi:hypothetical protein
MTRIYIRFLDGVYVRIPVEARLINDDIYQVMPNKEFEYFDYEDDGTLFEFGALDVVKVKPSPLVSSDTILVANELVEEGEKGNLQKRLLFRIESDQPDPRVLLMNVNSKDIVALLQKIDTAPFMYPAIMDWISIHRETIERSLK